MNTRHLLRRVIRSARGVLAAAPALLSLATLPALGTDIWDGPLINFVNEIGSDPTLPSSQDRMTPDVWLTRGSLRGLYNAAAESGYNSLSPVGTEWAYGELPNYAALNYQTWVAWNGGSGGGPPSMVGQDAVLHLISDDIYLGIRFTFWNEHGGGFTYLRSTPLVPEPSSALLLIGAAATCAGVGFYQKARRR